MTYLPKINKNTISQFIYENDLDKLAGYYKLSERISIIVTKLMIYEKTF